MALVFPTNPAVNQTHTDGTRSWKWTGARWQSVQATPLAHASSHAIGGSDALAPADIGAATTAQGAKADSALQSGAAISTISGLQTALDGKQASGSYAPASGISPTAISGTAVVTNDPRLSDSRTPTSHTHAAGDITSGTLADARLSANVVLTTDARLTNSRTPTSHKSTHSTGGADALTPSDIGAAASIHTHPLSQLEQSSATNGQVPVWNATTSAWVPQTPTSGVTDYNDLTNKPTLGTAASTDATAYATAAQGTKADSASQPGHTHSYNDLTNKPTLGTAAATDATAYATAAQGTKADSALQAAALTPYRTSAAQDTLDANKVTNGGGASTISVMTQAAYTALPVKDNNTIYILT